MHHIDGLYTFSVSIIPSNVAHQTFICPTNDERFIVPINF